MISAILAIVLTTGQAGTVTQLTFVRHGETQANATGRYTSGTLNSFSDRGQRQVASLTGQLPDHFDRILVSPSPRALYTIAPYLRRTHQRATVWPLLYECCTGRRPHGAHPTSFAFGARVQVPRDLRSLVVPLSDELRLPNAPDYNSGLAQVAAATSEFRERFAGGTVLLVGHSGQGGHMLHNLTGKWIKLDNAKPIRVTLTHEGRGRSRPLP